MLERGGRAADATLCTSMRKGGRVKSISADRCVYCFDPGARAVEQVAPGEVVTFETEDALGGQVQTVADAPESIDFSRVNPATGPLAVEGAASGDALCVEVLRIEAAAHGVALTGPGMGLLGSEAARHSVRVLPIWSGVVWFDDLGLAAAPMIGVIGVAPAGTPKATGTAGRHGGNLDTKELGVGTMLYLPVSQQGALLALGDVHAVMADGEICITGCEVAASVTVRVGVLKGCAPAWPLLETRDAVYILVSRPRIGDALREAASQGVRFIRQARGLSFEDAYILSSLAMDVRVSQLVDPSKTAKAVIPKRLLPYSVSDCLLRQHTSG